MKAIKKFLIKLYVVLFIRTRKVKWPDKSKNEFNRSMDSFSNRINEFPYKSDPLGGLIDYVDHPDNFFKEDKTEGRDCDDWARMWSLWGALHDYKATEWIVCNPKRMFKTMHVITILEESRKFYLMNFRPYGPYSTEEEALDRMRYFDSYKEDIIIVKSRSIEKG